MNFDCLASDSESEVLDEVLEDSEVESESETETESEVEEKPQENQFRVWKSEESRFSTVKNIFSSPFSKKKRRVKVCLLYTSPSPRDRQKSRMPSSA